MQKKLSFIVLTFIIALVLCGCSSDPVWYTDKEIKNHVKNVYGSRNEFISKETVKGEDDSDTVYVYNYKTKDGIKFKVESYTYKTGMKGSYWWEKGKDCNFEEAIISHYKQDILDELCESDAVSVNIKDTDIDIYVGNYKNIYNIADNIAKVDKLLSFNIVGVDNCKSIIKVYVKGTESNKYEAAKLKFSNRKSNRLTEKTVLKDIEQQLVTNVHKSNYFGKETVNLDKELLRKYKPTYMNVALNSTVKDISLTYNEELDTYTIDQFSFANNTSNEFMDMVLGFGGTYEVSGSSFGGDEHVCWSLNGSTWEVIYNFKHNGNYYTTDGFTVYKDDKAIGLSDMKYSSQYKTHRKYTIQDLCKLLNTKVVIDYDNYIINFKTK